MTRVPRWALLGALTLTVGCSRTEQTAPPASRPAPAAAVDPATIDEARAKLEAAAKDLATHAADGTTPQEPSAEEEARTRAAVEAVLQDVRRQLEEKAAKLGTAPSNAPAQP